MAVLTVAFSDKAVCESILSDFVIRAAILRDPRLIGTRLGAFHGMESREMAGISDPESRIREGNCVLSAI